MPEDLKLVFFFPVFSCSPLYLLLKLPVLSSFQEEGQKEKGNTCLEAEDLKRQITQGVVVPQMNEVIR